MKEFPKGGLIGKVMDATKTVKQMHIPLHAAYAAYFIILAFFPALVLILSVLRYAGMEVRGLVDLLGDILPSTMVGDAEELIYSTYRNSSGALVGVSAVTALWSASRGIYGMLTGLNAVYGVSENRGYIYTRSISVVYTFVFILILLLTLVLRYAGLYINSKTGNAASAEIPYSTFIDLIEEDKAEFVRFDSDAQLLRLTTKADYTYTDEDGKAFTGKNFYTVPISNDDLIPLLTEKGVGYTAGPYSPPMSTGMALLISYVLPFLLIMLMFSLVMRIMSKKGMGGIGGRFSGADGF